MKKIYLYGLLLIFGCTYGCSDFLDEYSQDEVRPSTVSDLEQIMVGDAYFNTESQRASNVNFYNRTDIFTDDIQCNGVNNTTFQTRFDGLDAQFAWNIEMFTDEGDGDQPSFWTHPYVGIGSCNVVLDYLDEMSGEEIDRENLRGEALVLRAWYYLHLVNFFGLPYNDGNAATNLGVPLQLTSDVVVETYPRNTVQEVYDQILHDLILGRQLMLRYPKEKNTLRITPRAAAAILSRVYLYMEDWDKTIAYADTVLSEQPELLNLASENMEHQDFTTADYPRYSVYGDESPAEIIWARPYGGSIYSVSSSTEGMVPWSTAQELVDSLLQGTPMEDMIATGEVNDQRALFYFHMATAGANKYFLAPNKPNRLVGSDVMDRMQGIRTAELYLNRAEGYIRKFMETGNDADRVAALKDLNLLRQNRYRDYTELNVTDAEELLNIYQWERRKELVGETNHRWCDIRRYGMTIRHDLFENQDAVATYELTPNMYALPIPDEAIDRNNNLKQNER